MAAVSKSPIKSNNGARPIANFTNRLDAKPPGDDWIARCPSYNDPEPSVSISVGADGPGIVKMPRRIKATKEENARR